MRVLVCYDVSNSDRHGQRRLRKIAEACRDHGVRVQFSRAFLEEFRAHEDVALPVGSRFPSTATDCQPLRLLMGSLYQGACQGVRASGLALRREMLYLVLVLSLLSPEGGVD